MVEVLSSEHSHSNGPPAVRAWPNLRALAQPYFDRTYAPHDCWQLVLDLLKAGGFVHIAADPMEAVKQVMEIWFRDDVRDPLTLAQPWDWLLLRRKGEGPAVGHIGLMVDSREFIHVSLHAGVAIEPLRRWKSFLVQVARLRCLV